MPTLTEAEEISDIAFGYMGSKALFAALHFGIFTQLAEAPATVDALAKKVDLPGERCRTLLTALAALGLVERVERRNGRVEYHPLALGPDYNFGWERSEKQRFFYADRFR